MSARWRHSLEGRLTLRLAAVTLAASIAGFAGLLLKSWRMAHHLSDEGEADVFVGEFIKEAGWAFPLFALTVIAIVALTVRASLRPVAAAARQAAAIAPGGADVRLATAGLPGEIEPFVAAVNAALDRLAAGFEAQRRFTADAAHELRTPLAILIAGLEALPAEAPVVALRADAARMARLVEQLLRVARLDALPAPVLARRDLVAVTTDLAAVMAPWVHAEGRVLAFAGATAPVWVMADADLLGSALRNLVENAVAHAPPGSEILIDVGADGGVAVIDHGIGIDPAHRAMMIERFWRAPGNTRPGAGLGLAIVAAVADVHGAALECETTPGGGATFRLALPRADRD